MFDDVEAKELADEAVAKSREAVRNSARLATEHGETYAVTVGKDTFVNVNALRGEASEIFKTVQTANFLLLVEDSKTGQVLNDYLMQVGLVLLAVAEEAPEVAKQEPVKKV